MRIIFYLLLSITTISCNNNAKKTDVKTSNTLEEEVTVTEEVAVTKDPNINKFKRMIVGTWKRTKYPFDEILFTETMKKFMNEEGNQYPSEFKKYHLSLDCSYDDKISSSEVENELFLINPEREICQKIKIKNDTLTYLMSHNNTIVYKKK